MVMTQHSLNWSLPQAINQTKWGRRRGTARGTREREGEQTAFSKQQTLSENEVYILAQDDKERFVATSKKKTNNKKGKMRVLK